MTGKIPPDVLEKLHKLHGMYDHPSTGVDEARNAFGRAKHMLAKGNWSFTDLYAALNPPPAARDSSADALAKARAEIEAFQARWDAEQAKDEARRALEEASRAKQEAKQAKHLAELAQERAAAELVQARAELREVRRQAGHARLELEEVRRQADWARAPSA